MDEKEKILERFGLTEFEVDILMTMFVMKQFELQKDTTSEDIAKRMELDEVVVKKVLASLVKKGMLTKRS